MYTYCADKLLNFWTARLLSKTSKNIYAILAPVHPPAFILFSVHFYWQCRPTVASRNR